MFFFAVAARGSPPVDELAASVLDPRSLALSGDTIAVNRREVEYGVDVA